MTNAMAAKTVAITERTLSEDQLAEYEREGYTLLKGLISAEDAAELQREVMSIMDVIGLGVSKLKQTREYLRGSALDSFVNNEDLRGIASQLMHGSATLYLPFTAVKSGGGGGRFHFHQDNQYTRFDGPGINLWFALSPMSEANGCLQVVPRSHLNGTLPSAESPDADGHRTVTFEPEDFVSVIMEPGDCIAFTRLTVHGSGPNVTDEPRVGYAVQYHRDNVRASVQGGPLFLIKEQPRFATGPVDAITPPTVSLDGH